MILTTKRLWENKNDRGPHFSLPFYFHPSPSHGSASHLWSRATVVKLNINTDKSLDWDFIVASAVVDEHQLDKKDAEIHFKWAIWTARLSYTRPLMADCLGGRSTKSLFVCG